MDDQRLVQLFRRFRDAKDAEALAKVFDCLAPSILKVARHLTRDPVLSEDLLQNTFLTAMERAEAFDTTRPLRPWLVGILLQHVRHQLRKSKKRLSKDRLSIPRVRDTIEIAEEREFEKAVEEAIGTLPEPYRQVLMPRLMQGLRGTEIAQKLDRSPGVVRMQIHRGLALLKRALPQSLMSALLGFLWSRRALASVRARVLAQTAVSSPAPLVPTILLGGTVMFKKALMISAGVLIAGTSLWILLEEETPDQAHPAVVEEFHVQGIQAKSTALKNDTVHHTPGEVELIPPENGPTEPFASPHRTSVAGRVLDAQGWPRSGIRIWNDEHEDQVVESDAAGRFLLPGDMPDKPLSVAPPYVLVRQGRDNEGEDLLLVVAPRIDVIGTVTNEEGIPLADTRIDVKLIRMVDFPEILDRARSPQVFPAQKTDAQGRFALQALPEGCAVLRLERSGYQIHTVRVDSEIAGQSRFVLQPLTSDKVILTGWVVDHMYRTVPEARVGLGTHQTESDDWGAFRIEFHKEEVLEGGTTLYAAKPGYQTRVIKDFGSDPESLTEQIEVELNLAGPALTISGRLLDADGKPLKGSAILLWKEDFLTGTSTAEDLAVVDEPPPRDFMLSISRALSITDAQGAFTLTGLSNRTYPLRVFDRKLGFAMTTSPIAAGRQGVELRIPANAFREKLSGRIVNRLGEPVSGASIGVAMQIRKNAQTNSWYDVGTTRSGDDGRFILPRACRLDTLLLDVSGADIYPFEERIESDMPNSDLVLVVDCKCYFRVTLSDPSSAHAFHMLDANDERLMITELQSDGSSQGFRNTPFPLSEGKTEVISTSERACTIQLLGKNERREPIQLIPDEITELNF